MNFILSLVLQLTNVGIMLGLTLGALCLARPVLKRLLTPRQRLAVWWVAWYPAFSFYVKHGAVLPVTFQDLVASRTEDIVTLTPAFLPSEYTGQGPYNLALPGDLLVPIQLRDWMLWAVLLIWLAGIAALLVTFHRKKKMLLSRGGSRNLDPQDPLLSQTPELRKKNVSVWLCEGLPTSFLCSGWFTHSIYLQAELPPERLDLVLRHEEKHISLCHTWWKWVATFVLVAFWWNPLVWLGFRCFCQDLELDCDSAVLKELPPERRKEYAKTILELGVGRQLWEAPLSFGECDGAVRVKAAAAWKPRRWWIAVPTWAAAVAIMLFFYGGHYKIQPPQDMLLAWERETGSVDNFVRTLEQEMARDLRTTWTDPVEAAEVWSASEEYPRAALWVREEDGTWYHVYYTWWMRTTIRVGVIEVEQSEPPDLTGCERLI